MKVEIQTEPTIEPISLDELKLHLRLDSGSFADNIDETQSLVPDIYGVATHNGVSVDVLGYMALVVLNSGENQPTGTVDVKIQESDDDAAWTDWATGAFIQVTVDGMLTSASLGIGTTDTSVATEEFTYFVAGSEYVVVAIPVGTAPGNDVIPVNKYGAVAFDIGPHDGAIDVIEAGGNAAGYATAAAAIAGLAAVGGGHVRIGTITAMRTAGNFTFGGTALDDADSTVAYIDTTLTANYNTIQEKAYTGVKQYIRAVAVVAGANCEFTVTIIRREATFIEDDLLNDIIKSARDYVEDITRRGLLTQTWKYYLDEWPAGTKIKLPFGNLQTTGLIVSYDYVDSAGAKQTTTMTLTTDYIIETNGEGCGFIILPYADTRPSFTYWPSNPITIQFACGWTTAALIPYKIKQAIKRVCSLLYQGSRGADVLGQSVHEDKTVMRLLQPSRLWDEF